MWTRKVVKLGNCLVVSLPKKYSRICKIVAGDILTLSVTERGFLMLGKINGVLENQRSIFDDEELPVIDSGKQKNYKHKRKNAPAPEWKKKSRNERENKRGVRPVESHR